MSVLLEKLKNLFSSNGLSTSTTKKQSALPTCIKTNEEPDLNWNIAEQIGDGAFGKIFRAINKTTGVEAALKRVQIDDAADISDYVVEIEILNQCDHVNILQLLESYYYGGQISIYLEYCVGGAVDAIMHELERPLSEVQISCVSRQLCTALDYIHSRGIIHRDLKAGNVLLTAEGIAKLADFGVSVISKSVGEKHNSFIGTPFWMAPEVIACETDKSNFYDCRADIWSFGITLIEFAQIDPPNHTMNPSRATTKIRLGDPPCLNAPHKWSTDFNDIIRKCLQKEPNSRLTAAQLLQHQFLTFGPQSTESLAELVIEVKAEVTIQVTDVDSVELLNAVCYDTQSSDGLIFAEDPSTIQSIAAQKAAEVVPSPASQTVNKTANKPMETVVLPSTVNEDINDIRAFDKTTGNPSYINNAETNTRESEVQVQRLTFGDDDDAANEMEYSNPVTDQFIFAHTKFPVLRHDGFFENSMRAATGPVVSEVDSNFSRQMELSPAESLSSLGPNERFHIKLNKTVKRLNITTDQKYVTQKVRYQSLTKTRRYVYEGKIVTRQTSKVIVSGMENVEQEEREMRKAELRALKLLQRAENRQREELDERVSQLRHQLERQLEQRRQEFIKSYAVELEALDREHRQKIKKLEASYNRKMLEIAEHLKVQQDRDLKNYRQEMKQRQMADEALLKGHQKEVAWSSLEQIEREYAAKEKKFIEQQQAYYEKKLRHCASEQRGQIAAKELALLNKKQQLFRCREAAVWEVEERFLLESGAMKKQQIRQLYDLLRRQLAFRRSQEMELVRRANERSLAALQRRLAADSKQTSKHLKKEYRIQRQEFCEKLEQRGNMTSEQEREALRQFEESAKQRMKEKQEDAEKRRATRLKKLQDRNAAALNELDEQFLTKQQTMMEEENALLQSEETRLQEDLRSFRESLVLRKKQLEHELSQQRNALDLSSIRLTDVNDMKRDREVKSEQRHPTPADIDLIFGDQTSTIF